jgi:DNA (cytosine-5)-methyltransferase 1
LNKHTKEIPAIIDLFSGCGGLAFGFRTAGFPISHGIEMVKAAADTASYNLYWRFGDEGQHHCGDITELDTEIFRDSIGKEGCIVIGGPPCQAYSQAGRAKLKSLGEDRSHINDSRGQLFEHFLRFAMELDARAVVMENVPESVDYGGLNVPQHVCEILEEKGYNAVWTILNSADYGVPQVRERVFVIAVKKSESAEISLPVPSHKSPDGKMTNWQMRMKNLIECKNFRKPNNPDVNLPDWITVEEALSDLPSLFPTANSKYRLFRYDITDKYKTDPQNSYQKLMRNWYGSEMKTVSGHGFRKTLRDFPIFERMKPGDDYRDASIIAEELLAEACRAHHISESSDSDLYNKLKKEIVPPYDREKFYSKWRKLHLDKPSHTLVAHLSVDGYSHLHPWEPRAISVREAARLQSFPDGFLFQCPMSDAFKQIGNAVPPLLSKAIAENLMKILGH